MACYLVQGGEVEVVPELQIDVLSVLRVFRVVEGVGGYEDILHEVLGHSVVCHNYNKSMHYESLSLL